MLPIEHTRNSQVNTDCPGIQNLEYIKLKSIREQAPYQKCHAGLRKH
jgi:hypothetical protein